MFGSSDFWNELPSKFQNFKIFKNALGKSVQTALPNMWLLVLIQYQEKVTFEINRLQKDQNTWNDLKKDE